MCMCMCMFVCVCLSERKREMLGGLVVRVDEGKGNTRAVFVQGTGLSSLARTYTYKHTLAKNRGLLWTPSPVWFTHYSHTLYHTLLLHLLLSLIFLSRHLSQMTLSVCFLPLCHFPPLYFQLLFLFHFSFRHYHDLTFRLHLCVISFASLVPFLKAFCNPSTTPSP